ncbi:MAG: hypothetical protein IT318_23860 [Anaerolineales bacterium]|nr:hypothetical protein [Anaerolineales bacterium]
MRFQLIENNPQFPNDGETYWWWDTDRPAKDGQPFMAVECYVGKNPNQFIRCENMRLLFTDQAEYYAVCWRCHSIYSHMQWSGSTRGGPKWRERAYAYLAAHEATKGWCQFCDPVFGNGGWLE